MDSFQNTIQQANLASLLGLHLVKLYRFEVRKHIILKYPIFQGLSLLGAVASNPTYNIPIFFFGIWAYNNRESNSPIKTVSST
jgi:hypothetical protein